MDLIFQSHTKSIVKPPNQNLSTLMRVEPFMTLSTMLYLTPY